MVLHKKYFLKKKTTKTREIRDFKKIYLNKLTYSLRLKLCKL